MLKFTTVQHLFMPGHTVSAAIKLHHKGPLSEAQLQLLIDKFNELNGGVVFSAGASATIPVIRSDGL